MTPDPVTCGPDDTVEDVATLMHDHDISRVPVVDDGRLVGIVARGDILRAIISARPRGADGRGRCDPPGPRSTSAQWPTTSRVLVDQRRPAEVWAVVKADGYGHGAVPVARAALDAGAAGLAVALVEEAAVLRDAGIEAPILLLSEARPDEPGEVVGPRPAGHRLHAEAGMAAAGRRRAAACPLPVHLKVDTGMHRVGRRPRRRRGPGPGRRPSPELALEAVWTHFAVADEPDRPFTAEQLARFDAVLADLAAAGIEAPLTHAANSAGAIAHPGARARPGPGRHRRLRRRPVPGAGRRGGPAAGPAPRARRSPW